MYPYIPSITLDTAQFAQVKVEVTALDALHLAIR
jgi:hypothetical protein